MKGEGVISIRPPLLTRHDSQKLELDHQSVI